MTTTKQGNAIYKTVYGYHTPEQSKKYFEQIGSKFPAMGFRDSSWHNDICDSCANDDLQIFFPNIEEGKTSDEDIKTFNIYQHDVSSDLYIECKTLEELFTMLEYIEGNEGFDIEEYLNDEKAEEERRDKLARPTEY